MGSALWCVLCCALLLGWAKAGSEPRVLLRVPYEGFLMRVGEQSRGRALLLWAVGARRQRVLWSAASGGEMSERNGQTTRRTHGKMAKARSRRGGGEMIPCMQ